MTLDPPTFNALLNILSTHDYPLYSAPTQLLLRYQNIVKYFWSSSISLVSASMTAASQSDDQWKYELEMLWMIWFLFVPNYTDTSSRSRLSVCWVVLEMMMVAVIRKCRDCNDAWPLLVSLVLVVSGFWRLTRGKLWSNDFNGRCEKRSNGLEKKQLESDQDNHRGGSKNMSDV